MDGAPLKEWDKDEEIQHLKQELQNAYREIARLRKLVDDQQHQHPQQEDEGLWIFGYGSLIWNAGSIPWVTRKVCCVRNYVRLFLQRSTDHRGTPQQPGRVVTLVHEDGAQCWGVGYFVRAEERERVLQYLDYREKDNYDPMWIPLYGEDGEMITEKALCYVGKKETLYQRSEDLQEIASHIASSVGPSGTNSEYALKLQRSLSQLHLVDHHIYEIACHLLK